MHENTNVDRSARLADLHARLDAGEFTAAFSMDSEPGDGRLAAQRRDDFRLYGYAARVDHDPAVDFEAFLEDLWVMVASRFQLAPDEEVPWAPSPRAWWDDADASNPGCSDEAVGVEDSPTSTLDVPAEDRMRQELRGQTDDADYGRPPSAGVL